MIGCTTQWRDRSKSRSGRSTVHSKILESFDADCWMAVSSVCIVSLEKSFSE